MQTIVISGGSINGIICLGALQYLINNKLLDNITTFIGTSSGSMTGFLLSIGYIYEYVYRETPVRGGGSGKFACTDSSWCILDRF